MKISIIPDHIDAGKSSASRGIMQKIAKAAVLKQLTLIEHGEIRLRDADGEHVYGQKDSVCSLTVDVEILYPDCYVDIAFGGDIGVGEAYIKGLWRCNNITQLVRIFVLNRDALNALDSGPIARLFTPLKLLMHKLNQNNKNGSARNIQAHYDIGNTFFKLFLDSNLMYSSAIYPGEQSGLEEASQYKLDVVCKKLNLNRDDHLLEIGTGWGGLALHAAKNYGCRVTTTTISKEQYELAKRRIADEGLSGRITVLMRDYRDLDGQYDKLVSIEMIEAVGKEYLTDYFKKCSSLLKDNGMMLLQSITIADQFYDSMQRSVDFIRHYIFPGGCLPSVSVIMRHVAQHTDFRLIHMDDFGEHYARTLAEWRQRFFNNIGKVKELGYPDTFIRMWEYYLCYCEGGFLERSTGVTQMVFGKPLNRHSLL